MDMNMRDFHTCIVYMLLFFGCVIGLNTTENTNEDKRKYSGQCLVYNGTHCEKILNSSDVRFINATLRFNGTETIVGMLGIQLDIIFLTSGRELCRQLLEKVICYYLFPPCSAGGHKVDYCREDCQYLFEICGGELNKLVGAGKAILFGKASGLVFRFDECDLDYKSEEDYLGTNSSCQHLPFIDIPPKPQNDGSKIIIIILSVVIPVVLLILGVLLWRRIRSRKNRAHSIHYENSKDDGCVKTDRLSNVISMRDRIREWQVKPSELIELVNMCKTRGVKDIPVDNIEYLKDLGAGQYGLVFQGKVDEDIEGETTRIVAVKTLREGSSEDAIKEFCQEVNIMSTFMHPHVVKLIGVSLAEEPYCMIFEYVEFGDLASFLRNCAEVVDDNSSPYPKLTVTDQLSMALQIGSGMKYISSIRCVHRDLAARNCLVGRGLVVKISDFGLSRDVYASEYYRMEKTRMLPVRWLPPEAFTDGKFTAYSDVYSYGVLLWEIFTFAKLPYEDYDNTRTMELILEGKILDKPDNCPDAVYGIMKNCWLAKPEERIMFPDIINELCSLDDYGQQFQASMEQVVENYGRRISGIAQTVSYRNQSNSLGYSNNNGLSLDEAPINVERLPVQTMEKNPSHYSTPRMKRNISLQKGDNADKKSYDGVVVLSETDGHDRRQPDSTDEGPLVPSRTMEVPNSPYMNYGMDPPHDISRVSSKSELIAEDPEESQETYDVPPATLSRQVSKESGIHLDSEEHDETYDVPPVPPHYQGDHEEPQETYDIPPTSNVSHPTSEQGPDGYDEESQETYDVPPVSRLPEISLQDPQETNEVPPVPRRLLHKGGVEEDGKPQETYDVPANHEEISSDKLYQNSLNLQTGLYSVPQSPYLQRKEAGDNQSTLPSIKRKNPYENVDLDGKPLI